MAIMFVERATGLYLDPVKERFCSPDPINTDPYMRGKTDAKYARLLAIVAPWYNNRSGPIERIHADEATPEAIAKERAFLALMEWREANPHRIHEWDRPMCRNLVLLAAQNTDHHFALHFETLTGEQKRLVLDAYPDQDREPLYVTVNDVDATLMRTMGANLIDLTPIREVPLTDQ